MQCHDALFNTELGGQGLGIVLSLDKVLGQRAVNRSNLIKFDA
jgi:hypothetical protein